jgi:dienelactone hydrolase
MSSFNKLFVIFSDKFSSVLQEIRVMFKKCAIVFVPRLFKQICICLMMLAGISAAQAKLVEEVIKVPVKVNNAYGRMFEHEIVATVWYDDAAPKPYPVAVLNHGRAVKPEDRNAMARVKFTPASRWLTRFGFLVVVPTRMGYGETGGEDVEDAGSCNRKNYPPSYEAGTQQTIAALEAVQRRLDTAKDKVIFMGQSLGGAIAITAASKPIPGLVATINFAGGGGGNPDTQPQQPCSTAGLKKMFADYGKTAKVPTLWIYTENDQWMGPKFPREWFEAFKESGGQGEFVLFSPLGTDGHGLFTKAPEIWQPKVREFLNSVGFKELGTK